MDVDTIINMPPDPRSQPPRGQPWPRASEMQQWQPMRTGAHGVDAYSADSRGRPPGDARLEPAPASWRPNSVSNHGDSDGATSVRPAPLSTWAAADSSAATRLPPPSTWAATHAAAAVRPTPAASRPDAAAPVGAITTPTSAAAASETGAAVGAASESCWACGRPGYFAIGGLLLVLGIASVVVHEVLPPSRDEQLQTSLAVLGALGIIAGTGMLGIPAVGYLLDARARRC